MITNIKKQDVQDKTSEGNIIRLPDDQKATQWCFVQYESVSQFAREMEGKMHGEIMPPLYTYACDTEEGSLKENEDSRHHCPVFQLWITMVSLPDHIMHSP